jgi:hypothetical protein
MTVTTPQQVRSTHDEWRDRRWRVVGLLLATMALATAALMVTTGTRPATYGGVLDQYASVQVESDPRVTLRGIDPDVRLTEGPPTTDHAFTFMGWGVPWQVGLLGVASWLAVLLLIVGGPEPWRATRWAWGWAWLLTGPLGSVAYLLLGGPIGVARPRTGHRRLTGGWAFLLAWVLFAGWRETYG